VGADSCGYCLSVRGHECRLGASSERIEEAMKLAILTLVICLVGCAKKSDDPRHLADHGSPARIVGHCGVDFCTVERVDFYSPTAGYVAIQCTEWTPKSVGCHFIEQKTLDDLVDALQYHDKQDGRPWVLMRTDVPLREDTK
jgi:hypothetical protein